MHPIHHISKLLKLTVYYTVRYTYAVPMSFQQFYMQEANILISPSYHYCTP